MKPLSTVIKRRSFSFLLARRYLNPRRSMLSSFTLISLVGVMLGVLVLVVVMAVYAGLERNVKGRILGFTPHILLRRQMPAASGDPHQDLQNDSAMATTRLVSRHRYHRRQPSRWHQPHARPRKISAIKR